MNKPLFFIILILVIGVVVGVFIKSDHDSPDLEKTGLNQSTTIETGDQNATKYPVTENGSVEIRKLNQLLNKEIRARQALEQKLETLNRQMANLETIMQSFNEADDSERVANDVNPDDSDPDDKWFNEQALIESGMASSQALELKVFFEQLELERLYLRDQSIREDWDRAKYREALQTLANQEDDLRNRLSESEYDAYLFASGQTNRVVVTSVLASAQAGTAGIMSGDQIIRYDNQRIYNGFDLREATAGGSIDDTVALEVERDGETLQFYLPRGPLGIRMNSVSVAP